MPTPQESLRPTTIRRGAPRYSPATGRFRDCTPDQRHPGPCRSWHGVGNSDTLRTGTDAVRFVNAFFMAGKLVDAICHGPWTIVEADMVRGWTLTAGRAYRPVSAMRVASGLIRKSRPIMDW